MTTLTDSFQAEDLPELDPDENVSITEGVEQMLRDALCLVEARLAERRALRDSANAQIKILVTETETLMQALRPFSRRTTPQTNGDS